MWYSKAHRMFQFLGDKSGATAVEYGLMIGLVSAVMVVTLPEARAALAAVFAEMSTALAMS